MKQFPQGFVFGAATAAYQVEGAVEEDGRGPSIWDVFCRLPGKVFEGQTGERACDQYHRYAEDAALMRDLRIQSYRFSIAWPRVFPDGGGALNQSGLDYYSRLCESLLERGIEPVATLYHWDLPQALDNRGGWLSRDTAERFAEYARTAANRLGGLIPRFVTVNEPSVAAFEGYLSGRHAPGRSDAGEALRAAHHLLLAHALAVPAIRSERPEAAIGASLNLTPVYPADQTPENSAAARTFDGQANRWFLDPVLKGEYPEDLLAAYASLTDLSFVDGGDPGRFKEGRPDFLGVNYYFPSVVEAGEHPLFVRTLPPAGSTTDMGWPVDAGAMLDLLLRLRRDDPGMPLYITENGAAYPDVRDGRTVRDPQRKEFLRGHLRACLDALNAGVDLRGYYVWSLLDNFEWAFGYSKRFGIVYVDFSTQERVLKESALYYREVIRTRAP